MSESALVFMDTETTGLGLDDDVIWEFAAIRREPDGTERTVHVFVDHDEDKCATLPSSFLADHLARFPGASAEGGCPGQSDGSIARDEFADLILTTFAGDSRPHVVGAVPNFDTERLALVLDGYDARPNWHYHLIDVENLAVGWLYALRGFAAESGLRPPAATRYATFLPWDSEELSLSLGVKPPSEEERHTAMGDAQWAMRLYDVITRD